MRWMSKPGVPKEVPDEEIVKAVMAVDEPFASTAEVAERTGLKQPSALKRLKTLRDEGVLGGKRAGNGWGWWVR